MVWIEQGDLASQGADGSFLPSGAGDNGEFLFSGGAAAAVLSC